MERIDQPWRLSFTKPGLETSPKPEPGISPKPDPGMDGMIKEVKKGFEGACKAAGLKYGQYESDGITFHTLRHRFNSKLAALGVK